MPRKSYAQELVRRNTGRDPEELVRELYVQKRHTQDEVAVALGISRSTLSDWLRDWGITRDDRPLLALSQEEAPA